VETRLLRMGCSFLLFTLVSMQSLAQQVQPQPLITQPIIESQLTTLRGNTHPLAQPQFDIGIAAPNLPLQRMLLVLKRSPQQDFALRTLLDDQQDKASPNYHKWLTPDEFGVQFGPSDQDVQLVTGWLLSSGFQVIRVAHGRTVIEFSGTEAQVEAALHTQIHQYLVNGQQYWANASDPQIPVALAPAVAGVLSLNNFPRKWMSKVLGTYSPRTKRLTPVNPQFTLPGFGCYPNGTCYAVGPADFGAIYNVQPLWNAGTDGTGQTIAIVGESDINIQDDRDFRTLFGLPAKDPVVIYDGPNPGPQPDESEADIDVQWSGAIAPNATIDFVVSQSTETTAGVDLSAVYIIDNNLAPVMSESYGFCELGVGTSGNQFYNAIWEEAAAQGITAILSSGDQGSAGCDFLPQAAQFGLAVSGFASTPFNVAVGGTDFNDFVNPQQYWNLTNTSPTEESAKGYIPETTWDLSCTNSLLLGALGWGTNAETNCNNPQLASLLLAIGGSGGVSSCTTSNSQSAGSCSGGYTKPSWQVAPGVPADGKRDLPDISLFASNGVLNSFYIFCEADASKNCGFGSYGAAGGTSFGAPAFAGIMALVNQQMQTPQGQGNANYVLYKLAAQQSAASCNSTTGPGSSCVFNDITSGTIAMPCFAGSPNCTVQTAGHQYGVLSGYSTGAGYDLATGLGSLNVNNLVTKWSTVMFRGSATTLTLAPASGITHGQSVNVSIAVAPGSGSGTPTGDVSLLTSTGVGVDGFTLSNGSASGTTNLLPGGTYKVTAHYAGDNIFGGSDSPAVDVTVGKENSSTQLQLETFTWQGNLISQNASAVVYGSPYLLRVNVLNSQGGACNPSPLGEAGCPSGNVTMTDNGNPLDAGTFALNSLGYTEDQMIQLPGGSHPIKAQYAGDNSFNSSSASTTYSIATAPTSTSAPIPVNNLPVAGATALLVTAVQSSPTFGAPPTGSVTFLVNGSPVTGQALFIPGGSGSPANNFTASSSAQVNTNTSPFPTPGHYTVTASYSGDGNYQSSVSVATALNVQFPTPSVLVQASNLTPTSGSPITLTATVSGASKTIAPTGTIMFDGNNEGILTATVLYTTVTNASTGFLDLQGSLTLAPTANDTYSAQYNGDSNYPAQSFSNSVVIIINGADFSISAGQPSVTVTQGSQTNAPLTVGFESSTAPVGFAANACTGLPNEATCSFLPNPITTPGYYGVTIRTFGPHPIPGARGGVIQSSSLWPAAVLPFATLVLIGIPRRRARRALRILLLSGLLALFAGCGGGGGSTPPPPPLDPGTPRGTYTIAVTATSGSFSHSASFQLIVQ
jgi:hypothetical protein